MTKVGFFTVCPESENVKTPVPRATREEVIAYVRSLAAMSGRRLVLHEWNQKSFSATPIFDSGAAESGSSIDTRAMWQGRTFDIHGQCVFRNPVPAPAANSNPPLAPVPVEEL